MPSGEVFTGPLETSAEGRVRFTLPSSPGGVDGRGRRARVPRRRGRRRRAPSAGEDYLRATLATDDGRAPARRARHRHELRHRPRRSGRSSSTRRSAAPSTSRSAARIPRRAARTQSAVHWDLICDLRARRPPDAPTATPSWRRALRHDPVARPAPPSSSVACMRRTKIVATIGPASRDPEVLVRMVDAGMDVARLNFSHGTPRSTPRRAQLVRDAAGRAGRPVAILQDLPGPEAAHRPARATTWPSSAGRPRDVRVRRRRRPRATRGA